VIGVAVLFLAFFLYLAPRLVRRWARRIASTSPARRGASRNTPLILALLLCLGASALANSFQLASIVGALLAGMALSELRDQYDLRASFEALNTFFVPFFFAGIGLLVSINELVAIWPLAAALTILAVAGKLASVPVEARRQGPRSALRVASGLVPRGEVAILVAIAAFDAGFLSGDLYAAIVVMAAATSVIGPLMLHRLFREVASTPPGPTEPEAMGV
jgi:Kef-type K+ transport system membrane component KefB